MINNNAKIKIDKKRLEQNQVNFLSDLVFENGGYFPNTLTYKDIDQSFFKFVENDLMIEFENTTIPSFFLTQQRFSEFTKTWQFLDDDKNILMNFNLVARDPNPKLGTGYNELSNVVGDYYIEYLKVKTFDGVNNGVDVYKMKQPMSVDLSYDIRIVTNKYELLNNFNVKVLDKFKTKHHYLNVNGYYILMALSDVSDESEKDVNGRKFYSQVFSITVKSYIIQPEDFMVEKGYQKILSGIELDTFNTKPDVYVEEHTDSDFTFNIVFPPFSKHNVSFKSDDDYVIDGINTFDNIERYVFKINDKKVETDLNGLSILKNDKITIGIVKKRDSLKCNFSLGVKK